MTETLRLSGGTTVTVLLAAEQTNGTLSLLELELEPGAGAGPHRHTREDETIVVLRGALRVFDVTLRSGEVIHLPRGVTHSFANEGPELVRALFVCTPGGLERFFRAAVSGNQETIDAAIREAGLEFD